MSATQRRLGLVGSQLRRTRSGEVVIPGTEIVVLPLQLGNQPGEPPLAAHQPGDALLANALAVSGAAGCGCAARRR